MNTAACHKARLTGESRSPFAGTPPVVAAWRTVHSGKVLPTLKCRAAPLPASLAGDLVPGLSKMAFRRQRRAQEGRRARCADPDVRACN